MSYVDGKTGNNQKALTGGLAALIQGGIALALINGFAVTIFEREPPPRLEGEQIKLDPLPPEPTPDPVVERQERVISDPVAIAPTRKPPIDINKPVDVTPLLPSGDLNADGDLFVRPVPPTSPRFTPKRAQPSNEAANWVTSDDYPTRELRAGHQGMVRFALAVDARGRVSDCTILASSGHPGLDEATCRYVSQRARFEPAINGDGESVAGSYSGTIRWVIPRD